MKCRSETCTNTGQALREGSIAWTRTKATPVMSATRSTRLLDLWPICKSGLLDTTATGRAQKEVWICLQSAASPATVFVAVTRVVMNKWVCRFKSQQRSKPRLLVDYSSQVCTCMHPLLAETLANSIELLLPCVVRSVVCQASSIHKDSYWEQLSAVTATPSEPRCHVHLTGGMLA